MNEIEQLQQQLRKQEKLASLGMLCAGIAHEIQNPLNFVINFSKMSERLINDLNDLLEENAESLTEADRDDMDDIMADLRQNMAQIAENGERAVSIIQGILLVARGKENEFVQTDVCKLVKQYVWMAYHAMRANHPDFNVSIHEEYDSSIPPMSVIPQDLSRAVLNVMSNACYAVWQRANDKEQEKREEEYKPEINVGVKATDGNLLISIADNGMGMTDEVKERLFENFFTTKPIGQGTGLGMAITRDIIEQKHGGKLSFTSTLHKGTTFTFTIPFAS
ncbi:MAG: GHKL domain-containing protein [Prevotella sp.]|nr:GHKL domain-containing protein [Prevotella sp.]